MQNKSCFFLPVFNLSTARKQAFSSPRDDESDYRKKEEGFFKVYKSREDLLP